MAVMRIRQAPLRYAAAILLLSFAAHFAISQRRANHPVSSGARTLTILAEPNAIVWVDEIRRGATDAAGKLALLKISSGAHTLRVRASGFKELTMPIPPSQRGEIRVRLLRTNDEAELAFQQAET